MGRNRLGDDVVISGVGCVSPLGADSRTTWRRLMAGETAVRRLAGGDLHGLWDAEKTGWIGAPAPPAYQTAAPLLPMIRSAVGEATRQANWDPRAVDLARCGTLIGTSKGNIVGFGHRVANSAVSETMDDWLSLWPNATAAAIAQEFSLTGPCLAPVAACATGLVCVLQAARLVESGVCDFVIAGSADASLQPAILAAFQRMGVLAGRAEDPQSACRPFQVDRDGFFVGEGAAAMIVERRDHAVRRGAQPLATWRGGSLLSDPSGLAQLDASGQSLSEGIGRALDGAQVTPDEVGHINLHGTATIPNDLAEATSLFEVLGRERARLIPCVALKPAIGHLLGAAGGVELAMSVLAIAQGEIPPTRLSGPLDVECELGLSGCRQAIRGAGLKISMGFGGHVAVGCLMRP